MKSLKRKSRTLGQSAVEFALVLPMLVLLLVGMMEVGRLVFIYVSVFNAAREAARFGQVTAEIGGIKQYQNCSGIRDRAVNFGFLSDYTANDVEIHYDQGPGTTLSPECASMTAGWWNSIQTGSRIIVTVNADYAPILPFVPLSSFTIVSSSARTILGTIDITP